MLWCRILTVRPTRAGSPPTPSEQPLLADSRGQPRVVAVARHDAKPADGTGVQQVHGVNDERAVRGVLSFRVPELLLGLDGKGVKRGLPAGHLRRRPVTVNAPRRHRSVLGRLSQHVLR